METDTHMLNWWWWLFFKIRFYSFQRSTFSTSKTLQLSIELNHTVMHRGAIIKYCFKHHLTPQICPMSYLCILTQLSSSPASSSKYLLIH